MVTAAKKAPAKTAKPAKTTPKVAPVKTATRSRQPATPKPAAVKIKIGMAVTWTQRTRSGENTYSGIVKSGNVNGKRVVKLALPCPSRQNELNPREEWLKPLQA